jgi:hypothetical protein
MSDSSNIIDPDSRQEIERLLGEKANPARLHNRLERLARTRGTPRQLMERREARKRLCQNFIKELPDMDLVEQPAALTEQLQRQIRSDDEEAKRFRQLAETGQTLTELLYFEALWAFETDGDGGIGYSSPKTPQSDGAWADTKGNAILFLQVIAGPVLGKELTVELTVSRDGKVKRLLSASRAREILAAYRKCHYVGKGGVPARAEGNMTIDDSKVGIYVMGPDRQLVPKS